VALDPVGNVAELAFPTEGVFQLAGTLTGGQGQEGTQQATTTVRVYSAGLPFMPSLILRERIMTRPALASGVVLDADPRLGLLPMPGNTTQIAWQTDDNVMHHVVARGGEGGPVLAVAEAPGTAVHATIDTYTNLIQTLPDGTREVETLVILSPVRPEHSVKVEVIVAGVVLDDGTRARTLAPEDFDELGMARVRFLMPPGTTTSSCHRTHLTWRGNVIGTR
jgi:hypothetical protein